MRAILDIFLAVIFTIGIGGFSHNIYMEIKKESPEFQSGPLFMMEETGDFAQLAKPHSPF